MPAERNRRPCPADRIVSPEPPPSSSGPGRRVLSPKTGVRLPVGVLSHVVSGVVSDRKPRYDRGFFVVDHLSRAIVRNPYLFDRLNCQRLQSNTHWLLLIPNQAVIRPLAHGGRGQHTFTDCQEYRLQIPDDCDRVGLLRAVDSGTTRLKRNTPLRRMVDHAGQD